MKGEHGWRRGRGVEESNQKIFFQVKCCKEVLRYYETVVIMNLEIDNHMMMMFQV
jgi:hypothetical protein